MISYIKTTVNIKPGRTSFAHRLNHHGSATSVPFHSRIKASTSLNCSECVCWDTLGRKNMEDYCCYCNNASVKVSRYSREGNPLCTGNDAEHEPSYTLEPIFEQVCLATLDFFWSGGICGPIFSHTRKDFIGTTGRIWDFRKKKIRLLFSCPRLLRSGS